MVKLFTDRRMLAHTPPARHPERPERLQANLAPSSSGPASRSARPQVWSARRRPPSSRGSIRRTISTRSRSSRRPAAAISKPTPGSIAARTWPHGLAAGLLAIEAVACVLAGTDQRAMALVRPPGHHARPAAPMGFCLYGTVAVAAADARDRLGIERILIVDFDVHHGNGTQEIFYDDGRVAFFSIHRAPFYPGTGAAG